MGILTSSKNEIQSSNTGTIIGKGTHLEGNITTIGNLRIEGKITGGVHTKAKIVLSTSALVKGNIVSQNAEIGGEVQGTIEVLELLVLKATAIIQGDIIARKLIFEEGAKFNGKCKIGDIPAHEVTKEKEGEKASFVATNYLENKETTKAGIEKQKP